jgi:hypothetical protein
MFLTSYFNYHAMDLPHDIYYRNLPHWQPPGAIMFVTARTAGSLPRAVEEKFRRDAKTLKENLRNLPGDAPELINAWKKLFQYADENMDNYRLAPYLEGDEAAATVVASIYKGAEFRHYILHRYCVMSNHIHLLIEPLPYETDQHLLKDLPPCWPPLFYSDSGRDLLCQGRRPEDLRWQRVAKLMGVMKGATSRRIRKAGTIEGGVAG